MSLPESRPTPSGEDLVAGMANGRLETNAFELRAKLSHWFARRGVPAVAEIVGPMDHPELQVRPIRTDGSLDPTRTWDGFPVRDLPVEDQLARILRELTHQAWWEANVLPPVGNAADLWCTPV